MARTNQASAEVSDVSKSPLRACLVLSLVVVFTGCGRMAGPSTSSDRPPARTGASGNPSTQPNPPLSVRPSYQVMVDFKPPLDTLKRLPERTGLSITPQGLFLVYPNQIIALDWKQIEKLESVPDDSEHGPTMLMIDTPQLSEIDSSIVVHFSSHTRAVSKDKAWDPVLAMPQSAVTQIARAAGLVPSESEDSYVRNGGRPRPPTSISYFPFDQKAPSSISVPLKQIAKLPQALGAICNQDGIFWCTPTSIESIRWNRFRILEVREDVIFAGVAEESYPGDYSAISFEGKGPEPSPYFLNNQDFRELTKLLRTKRRPKQAAVFSLVSEHEKTGPAILEKPGPNPFLQLKLGASPSIWPGTSLIKLKPIRSGIYLLPAGFIRVSPQSIFQASWDQIQMLSVGGDGQITIESGEARFTLQRASVEQTAELLELGKSILAITQLTPAESGGTGSYFKREGQPVAPSDSRLFLAENADPDWQGPSPCQLGSEPWPDGFHFTREGMYFVRGPSIEAVQWDRLRDFSVNEKNFS